MSDSENLISVEQRNEETAEVKSQKPAVKYSISPGFVTLLESLNIAVALTSYQSGRFYFLGKNPRGGLMVDERIFQKAMGIFVQEDSMILATLFQIHRFENLLEKNQFVNKDG